MLLALKSGAARLFADYSRVNPLDGAWRAPPLYAHAANMLPTLRVCECDTDGEFIVRAVEPAPGADTHLAFVATTERWGRVLLKFSRRRYGIDAHLAAAQAGHAPELLGQVTLPGDWTAVVMELLGPGWRHYDPCDEGEKHAVLAAYNAALYAQSFVHGDLRPPNVLVGDADNIGSGGTVGVKFIDWDWAGRAGTAFYPLGLNQRVRWPDGVTSGALITRVHDLAMLQGAAGGNVYAI